MTTADARKIDILVHSAAFNRLAVSLVRRRGLAAAAKSLAAEARMSVEAATVAIDIAVTGQEDREDRDAFATN